MRIKKAQKLYQLTLVYANNMTRSVKVRASSREVAEQRALKRNPNALSVRRDA